MIEKGEWNVFNQKKIFFAVMGKDLDLCCLPHALLFQTADI